MSQAPPFKFASDAIDTGIRMILQMRITNSPKSTRQKPSPDVITLIHATPFKKSLVMIKNIQ